MNKKVKIIINVLLALSLLASLIWGYVARNINCWFEKSCDTEEMGYWPFVFLLLTPLVIVATFIVINKKK